MVVQACVFAMEAESAARLRDALKVQKDILDYVFHMAVDVGGFSLYLRVVHLMSEHHLFDLRQLFILEFCSLNICN